MPSLPSMVRPLIKMEPQCGQQANHFIKAAYITDLFEHFLQCTNNYDGQIVHLYTVEKLSLGEVGLKLGLSRDTVTRSIKRLKIPIRNETAAFGRVSNPPFGWCRENGKLVPYGEEQRVIRKMEAAWARGKTLRAIARDLELAGVTMRYGIPTRWVRSSRIIRVVLKATK